ncbi:MAG: ATP-binding protein, partial [Thermomicrobiales bacterium]
AQLDGLPLALELAAAQLRLLSLDALFGRLATRIPELVGGPRDAPARQRTMRLAIAWSYDMLTVDEAAVFRRIAVFVGGCTQEAAVAVCNAVGGAATVSHALASLMDKSLVQCQEQEPDVSRFTMLEVVREYAWERLVAHDEAAAVARDHALYFLTLAESTAPDLMGARTARSLRRLEEDHANLRAALRWTQQSGEGATGLRIAAALWRFWQGRGYLREGREWLELMLARTADTGEDVARARIEALIGAGMLAMRQGEVASAMALLTEGLARAYALGDPALIADALNALGYVALSREAFVQARVRYEEALALYRTLDDPWCIATALGNLANVAQRLGDNRGAVALCEESLHIHRTLRDEYALGFVLTTFGTALGFLGEIPRARGALIETLTMRQRLGDRAGIAVSLLCLGNLAMRIGQSAEAAAYFEESVAIGQEIGSHRTVGYALRGLGDSARARNCPGDAIRWYAQTLREIQYLRVPSILIRECERLIALAHELGQHERVAPLLAATHALRDSSAGNPPSLLTAQALLPVQARAALCDAAFAATWDAEAAGSLDRAIDAVLASPTDQDVCILATHSSLDPSPTWKGEGKEF